MTLLDSLQRLTNTIISGRHLNHSISVGSITVSVVNIDVFEEPLSS